LVLTKDSDPMSCKRACQISYLRMQPTADHKTYSQQGIC